jgi:putative DNA primase/helicase
MLKITESGTILHPFNPEYYSRNPIPVAWNPEAKCAEFMDVLLRSAMGAADVDLLVRWSGSVLLGGNLAQRFMMLEGTAGGGKGTFVEVLEAIMGEGNSVQMRTALLEARFEIGRFVDKTLLAGKDVAGDFLEEPGASVIKSLVGHDKLTGEIKGSMETPDIRGTFGVVITCNSRLRVRLDGDVEAWRRRMLLIRYERPKPEHRIAGYSKKLLEKEAEGILVLFVAGAMRHLGELRELGDFRITAKQQERVDALLLESDSLRHFVEQQIYAVEGGVLPSADVVGAYFEFCKEEDWSPLPAGRVFRALPDIMMELFGSNLGSHGQNEKGERLNGYPKVALRRPGYTRVDIQL